MTDIHHDTDERLIEQYEDYDAIYGDIENRLETVRTRIETAPDPIAETILYLADTYSIITVMTQTAAADLAFSRLLACDGSAGAIDRVLTDTRARGEQNWSVMFPHNKAEYIVTNRRTVDYGEQLRLFRAGEFDTLHRAKIDEVTGLGATKAAFALAVCGATEKMCVDSNVARLFDYDPEDDVPNTVVVDRYDDFCAQLRAHAPTVQETYDLSNFIWQWVAFDARRNTMETHDSWFLASAAPGQTEIGPAGQ